jgi:hypothetical protein
MAHELIHATHWPSLHGFEPASQLAYYAQLHDLLLGLSGRMTDAATAELRAAIVEDLAYTPDAIVVAAIRDRVPVTRQEVNTIIEVTRGLALPGGDPHRIPELTLADADPANHHRFVSRAGVAIDVMDQAMAAAVRFKRGPVRAWRAWRDDPTGPRRVYLVKVDLAVQAWYLAHTSQRRYAELAKTLTELDARDKVPAVEVFWTGQELPPYQRAAMAHAELLWSRDEPDAGQR